MPVSGSGKTELSMLGVMGRTHSFTAKTEAVGNIGGDWYIVKYRHRGFRSVLFTVMIVLLLIL